MPKLSFNPENLLTSALSATGVHLDPRNILDGLDWQRAGATPKGAPHSIFQIVNHVIYWQDLLLSGLDRKDVVGPKQAKDGWPGAREPETLNEWEDVVERYKEGLAQAHKAVGSADPLSSIPAREETRRINVLNTLSLHTSYHVGQIALIRRMLGAWPPPGGGHTW